MRTVKSFNVDWYFIKDTEQTPVYIPDTAERISLPHTWNNEDGQDGGNDYFRGTAYYAKTITKAELPEAECYYFLLI